MPDDVLRLMPGWMSVKADAAIGQPGTGWYYVTGTAAGEDGPFKVGDRIRILGRSPIPVSMEGKTFGVIRLSDIPLYIRDERVCGEG